MDFENFYFTNFFKFFLKKAKINKVQKTFLQGSLMALTDMVPGVSGSTIALVLGFYQKLLTSIKNIEIISLFKFDFKKFIKSFDFTFLIPLIFGMIFSFLVFSKLLSFFLSHESLRAFFLSFFLGAVFSCIYTLLKEIKISFYKLFLMLIGAIISFLISYFSVADVSLSLNLEIKLIVSGFIAIFAMLLPGISGSLILVLFGVYPIIINALSSIFNFESFKILTLLAIGIFFGLLVFPKIILIFLEKYYFLVLSFLVGLMFGSIYALWPFWIYKKDVFANKSFLVATKLKIPEIFSLEFFFSLSFLILGFFIFFKIKQKFTKKLEKI
ncbi:MAG: hypothetical protein K1060chlam1_01357 [Candidatus Anoxychlamydiales bacterium]|nr:hypothetical protein [Candidatus Anoxychlamydiales bacterium]